MSTLRLYPVKLGLAFIVAAKERARDGCELGVKRCPCLIGTLIKPMGFINQQEVENSLCFSNFEGVSWFTGFLHFNP